MAGEHILKLLIEENARVNMGGRQLVCEFTPTSHRGVKYTIFERKPYAKTNKIIFITGDEEKACKYLKGE